jgi:hypothetical protein
MIISFKKYTILLLFFILVTLLSLAAYVYTNDPYWLFKSNPEWKVMYNGHNRVLDIRGRFAKSLQVAIQQPEIIIVGSSRIYRGIQTDSYSDFKVYNLGISNLRIREAHAFIIHAARWAPISEIILGIDYFMFDSNKKSEPGFDPSIIDFNYLPTAISTSLMTKMAFDDVKLSKSGVNKGDGYWTRSGFKFTNPRSAKDLELVLNSFYNNEKIITQKEFDVYKNILNFAEQQNIRISVFISPLNHIMIEKMKKKKQYRKFMQWKNSIRSISLNHGVDFYDFSEVNPFFNDKIENASTKYWIDTSHYSPYVGNWILNEIGIFSHKSKLLVTH